jgi:hypothetical protein
LLGRPQFRDRTHLKFESRKFGREGVDGCGFDVDREFGGSLRITTRVRTKAN